MSKELTDIEAMFKELEMIQKKYGIPKTIGFVPDKMEFILERKGTDKFELTYSEFFNYLPQHIVDIAVESLILFSKYRGIPQEKILRIENGVKILLSDDSKILDRPIIELLMQNKNINSEFDSIYNTIKKSIQMFSNFLDIYLEYDAEIGTKVDNSIARINKIIQENPSIPSQIENVIKKYTEQKDVIDS